MQPPPFGVRLDYSRLGRGCGTFVQLWPVGCKCCPGAARQSVLKGPQCGQPHNAIQFASASAFIAANVLKKLFSGESK